jgi:acetylornithine/N-succinyldiaminopimelate aminotransferase
MKEAVKKADILIEALPYIRNFKDKVVVIKFGGSLIDDIDITKFLEDVLFLSEVGICPILVHGGGPLISSMLEERGIESTFHNGLRITSQEALSVVREVLIDRINRSICSAISNLGGMARTLSGYDSGCISGVKHVCADGTDLGFVGEITQVNNNMIMSIAEKKQIPVISPIARDAEDADVFYNVNADSAAAAIAAGTGAEKIVFISNTHGIQCDGKLLSSLAETDARELIAQGVIQGGMIPKTEACIQALRGGVKKAHIISGLNTHALLLEIFTDEGVGTEILRDKGAQFSTAEVMQTFESYVIGNYTRIPVVPVRGKGSFLWDCTGKRYIDLFPGWAVNGLGHCHRNVVRAIKEQSEMLLHVPNNFYIEPQGRLAELISAHSFGGKCFFCNSGAEAVESAIKLARLHAEKGRHRIVSMEQSFHGRTLGAVSVTAQEKYHKGFPIAEGFDYVPFNDLEAFRSTLCPETCAVMLEVVQGEGGVNIADPEYVAGIRDECSKNGILLIVDEVQTGMGRTGAYFGYQNYDITPDIITMAKSLGGGVAIGAIEARPEVSQSLAPGTHASTFGGNPLAASAGIAVFRTIEDENLCQRSREMGDFFNERLSDISKKCGFIREVRNLGLMIGIELDMPGHDIVSDCIEEGVIINCTQDTVLRIIPAMTIPKKVAEQGLDIIEKVLLSV